MSPSVFLFDLDMSLVDSSALTRYRNLGHWTYVRENINSVTPLGRSRHAHLLPAQLRALGHKVGIVTSSPRWYAEHVLRSFEVPYDVLVAYGDTELGKPSRQPICKALELLGKRPHETIYIGDDAVDVEAAFHAEVLSVGAGRGMPTVDFSSVAPDILLADVPEPTLLQNLDSRGYIAEVGAGGGQPSRVRPRVRGCLWPNSVSPWAILHIQRQTTRWPQAHAEGS
ncbi:MAG TPA: HAD family hydrolase [Planctomycetaceae bacterium]|nr:HAD family hydrolase [Planctomycetaceae bacterium]